MRKQEICEIIINNRIAPDIFDMKIKFTQTLQYAKAGQFAQLYVNRGEMLLPRPISLCEIDKDNQELRLVYQITGRDTGTEAFSKLRSGDKIRVMAPLGNGFNINNTYNKIGIVGGGVGVPPMFELAKSILRDKPNADIDVFLGFREYPILVSDFENLSDNIKVHIATDNGVFGFHGNVLELMNKLNYNCEIIYSCGPKVMLKHLNNWTMEKNIPLYVSMEERMACGIGVCVGCAIPLKTGDGNNFYYKKVCKEGPVFLGSEVVFDEF